MSVRQVQRRRRHARAGASFGDVLLVLSALILLTALVAPRVRQRASEERRARVLETVGALRGAAEALRDEQGTWPDTRAGETLAPELFTGPAGGERAAERDDPPPGGERPRYAWRRLEIVRVPEPARGEDASATPDLEGVDSAEPPPPPEPELFHRGALSVWTEDDALLGALLERYGTERSFVHDSAWTLVLPAVRVPLPSVAASAGGG